MGSKISVYFPGLNGLRFFAALAVIITHVELLKGQVGLPNSWHDPLLHILGGLGVYFFFVLSGFLITYLLLVEKKETGTISVRQFYLRRIFRIWPLYYLIVLLAFFVFPHFPILRIAWFDQFFEHHFWLKLFLFIFILPNLALALYPRESVPHAGHTWSIGVEEQFYLIWPWVVRRSKKILRTVLIVGAVIVAIKIGIWVLLKLAHVATTEGKAVQAGAPKWLLVLKDFVAMTKFECMAIGAAGAEFAFNKREHILRWIFHPVTQTLSLLLLPVLVYFTPDSIQDGIHLIYSVCFLVIIMNTALNPRGFLRLENGVYRFLGDISYGLYMYHMFVVVISLRLVFHWAHGSSPLVLNIWYYSVSVLATIAVSALSYYLYEKPFIRLKRRFAKVQSGEPVPAGKS